MEEAIKTFLRYIPRNLSYPYLEESQNLGNLLNKIFVKHIKDLSSCFNQIPQSILFLTLEKLSTHCEHNVRLVAAEALASLPTEKALPLIQKLTTDSHYQVLEATVKAIANLPSEIAYPFLKNFITTPTTTSAVLLPSRLQTFPSKKHYPY